jgi:peptide/nickel transport system permease protein
MLVVWPSLALLVTVLAFNLLGENLRARWSGR